MFIKILSLILLFFTLTEISRAQTNLPPEGEKILLIGSIYLDWVEMTLVREGDKLSGSYFEVKSGRANSLKVHGTINAEGKFVLREFNAANKKNGEFIGTIGENNQNYDIYFQGNWTNLRGKYSQFSLNGQIIGFTGKRRIETHWISENNKIKRFYLSANYPEVVGENAAIKLREFNRLVKELTIKPIAEFRKRMFRQTAVQIRMVRDTGNDFDNRYAIKFADDDLISIQFTYQYTDANSDDFSNVETLTYDLKKLRKLKLEDLFKPDAKYLETISAYFLKELKSLPNGNAKKLTESNWANGTKPIAANYENWNVTRRGLLITFDTEEIATYPGEIQYVLVPYSDLKEIIQPDGVLEKMMKL